MQETYRVVIADTNCFILLDKIKSLNILSELFEQVTTTTEVASEFGKPLPTWIKIETVADKAQQTKLQYQIDKGEASAIALAIEKINALLILDDNKARKIAAQLNLRFTGTLGILLKAKEAGIIPTLKPVLEKIQQTNFRFSEQVFSEILNAAGE